MSRVWTARSAANSRASAAGGRSPREPLRRAAPIGPGVGSDSTRAPPSLSARDLASEDFPEPSIPSRTMNLPLIGAPLVVQTL